MKTPAEIFLEQIKNINESDYGDFMRKANSYLLELKDKEEVAHQFSLRNKIITIQDYLQYRPNWDIQSTLQQLIEDAEEMIMLENLAQSHINESLSSRHTEAH